MSRQSGAAAEGDIRESAPVEDGLQVVSPTAEKSHYQPDGMEVYQPDGMEVLPSQVDNTKASSYSAGAYHVPPYGDKHTLAVDPQVRRRRYRGWLFIALAVLAVIIIAVLGGVLGARARAESQTRNDAQASNNGQVPTTSQQPSNSSPVPGNNQIPSATALPASIANNTNLASIAYQDAKGVLCYRLYYQDGNDTIKESAYNYTARQWYLLNANIGKAKRRSPLAAAVLNDNVDLPISLFWIDGDGKLRKYQSGDRSTWVEDNIDTIYPDPSSNLAAVWHFEVNNPPAVLLFYQDSNQRIILLNSTVRNPVNMVDYPIKGSGLSVSLWTQTNYTKQLRLFYQTSADRLTQADWVSAAQISARNKQFPSNPFGPGWLIPNNVLENDLGGVASITSFPFGGSDGSVYPGYTNESGLSQYVGVLTSGVNGVHDMGYLMNRGSINYLGPTQPVALRVVGNGSAVTAHAWGKVYGMREGRLTEYSATIGDKVEWSATGEVVTS